MSLLDDLVTAGKEEIDSPGKLELEYVAKKLFPAAAKHFHAKTDADQETFKKLLDLLFLANSKKKDLKDTIDDLPTTAFADLKNAVDSGKTGTAFRRVTRLPAEDLYVIFSDFHTLYSGHRQDFFAKNAALYERVLSEYSARDYTLIENGDVFDLLVQEPTTAWVKGTLEALSSNDPWGSLKAIRKVFRLKQLGLILDTYGKTIYSAINRDFHSRGRYIVTAGNHDWDLGVDTDLINLLRQKAYPDINVTDVVVLEDSRNTPVAIICHGHQFDEECHPAYAYCLGEADTESEAWAFQGADRNWTWKDDVGGWATGKEPFRNMLVSGEPGSTSDLAKTGLEAVLGHALAWEYFENNSVDDILEKEVMTDNDPEWFKIRHMNEERIEENFKKQFGATSSSTLVLGHSHEVRLNAVDSKGSPFRNYINCGSAGRFENLIWATEIVNGEATLVSWHFEEGPGGSTLVRNVYNSSGSGTLYPTPEKLPTTCSRGLLWKFMELDSTRG